MDGWWGACGGSAPRGSVVGGNSTVPLPVWPRPAPRTLPRLGAPLASCLRERCGGLGSLLGGGSARLCEAGCPSLPSFVLAQSSALIRWLCVRRGGSLFCPHTCPLLSPAPEHGAPQCQRALDAHSQRPRQHPPSKTASPAHLTRCAAAHNVRVELIRVPTGSSHCDHRITCDPSVCYPVRWQRNASAQLGWWCTTSRPAGYSRTCG